MRTQNAHPGSVDALVLSTGRLESLQYNKTNSAAACHGIVVQDVGKLVRSSRFTRAFLFSAKYQ